MEITLKFEEPLNSSLQVGDTVWYTSTSSAGGYNSAASNSVLKLGTVEEISSQYRAHEIKVSNNILQVQPSLTNAFIMFSKNNSVNLTSLSGYYAKARFENNSKEKAELFAVSSEVSESSK
tara:strand:+ start:1544 stop:1906 length:363 start_codon:yes stop_codon:yes gene_type:complete